MDRPTHIEDALCRIHNGAWWTWTDKNNKIYSKLKLTTITQDADGYPISNPHSIPSEADVNAKLKEMQDAWDLEHNSYKSKRREEYPSLVDQLDKIYHSGIDAWKATIKATKDKYPKP